MSAARRRLVAAPLDRHAGFSRAKIVERSDGSVGQRVGRGPGGFPNHHARHVQRRLKERMHASEPFRRDADDGELDCVETDPAADDPGARRISLPIP